MAARAAEALVERGAACRGASCATLGCRGRQCWRCALAGGPGAGDRRDVGGDGRRVGAGDDLRRHQSGRSWVVDLVVDDLLDRAQPEVLSTITGERSDEIEPRRSLYSRVREAMAAAAFRDEELLPLGNIAAFGDSRLSGAATGRQSRNPDSEESGGDETHGCEEGLAQNSRCRRRTLPAR